MDKFSESIVIDMNSRLALNLGRFNSTSTIKFQWKCRLRSKKREMLWFCRLVYNYLYISSHLFYITMNKNFTCDSIEKWAIFMIITFTMLVGMIVAIIVIADKYDMWLVVLLIVIISWILNLEVNEVSINMLPLLIVGNLFFKKNEDEFFK